MNERYHWYKDHGICPFCGAEDGFKGGTLCLNCRGKQANSTDKYRSKMTDEQRAAMMERNRVRCANLYKESKEKGICVICHKLKAREGKTTCMRCFMKRREKQRLYQQERRDNVRKMQGVQKEV